MHLHAQGANQKSSQIRSRGETQGVAGSLCAGLAFVYVGGQDKEVLLPWAESQL